MAPGLQLGTPSTRGDISVLSSPQDFSDEIKAFIKRRKKNPQSESFPISNQDRVIMQTLRTLSTDYPYAILTGEPGIGKSMALEFIVNVLSGEIKFEDLEGFLPEDAINLFKSVSKRVSGFEHMDYLFLPNLKDPMNVEPLSYVDQNQFDMDYELSRSFCASVGRFLGNYASDNRNHIRQTMPPKDFSAFLKGKVREIYFETYSELVSCMEGKSLIHHPKQPVPLLDLKLKSTGLESELVFLENKDSTIKDWPFTDLKQAAGFRDEVTDIAKDEVEKGISRRLINKSLERLLNKLNFDLSLIDVEGETSQTKTKQINTELNKLSEQAYALVKEGYESGEVELATSVISYVENSLGHIFSPEPNLSNSALNHIASGISAIRETYKEECASEQLQNWMDGVVDYFSSQKRVLEDRIGAMLTEIEHLEREGPKITKKDKKKDISEKSEKVEEKKSSDEFYDEIQFKLPHGKYLIDVREIMIPNPIATSRSSDNSTYVKFSDFTDAEIFGDFSEYEEEVPPHTTVNDLGAFFDGGLLLFKDSFKDFVEFVVYEKEGGSSMKERFLEYLQSGKLTLNMQGVSYTFNAPRMILGCDNDDPFERVEDGFRLKRETGLEARITQIEVAAYTGNTEKSRTGTLRVLYNALDKFNKDNKSEIALDTKAANILLTGMLPSRNIASLSYRNFVKQIQEVCSFALSKKEDTITLDLLKRKTKDSMSPTFFNLIDSDYYDIDGYQSTPDSDVGLINGLAYNGTGKGTPYRIRSTLVHRLGKLKSFEDRFRLVDKDSEMVDENTIKGHLLATEYLSNYLKALDEKIKNKDWTLSTQFHRQWSQTGGPSASAAMGASMISAMSQTPIYKNRFITGTLEPNGDIGQIGGTYIKGTVPTRLKDLAPEEDFYFLFPVGNLSDLRDDLRVDPLDMENKISLIPLTTFPQAYHLLTSPGIDDGVIRDSLKHGEELLIRELKKIQDNF